jgi:ribose-phosphate pyrophosphokinase
MKFFSLNKSNLSKKVFAGIQYNENSFKGTLMKILAQFGYNMPKKSFTDDDQTLKIDTFADGEMCPIFSKSIRDEHVTIMADGHSSEDILKLLLTIDAAKRSGAKKITVILPYFPYARQDKNDHVRSSIGAKMMANLLENVGVTRIISIEMHSPAIQGFFDIPVIHLNGNRIFGDYAKAMKLENVTNCSPDHGAIKRNADFAKYNFPDCLSAVIDKKRKKPNEVASMEITGEENIVGRNVVCVDDMGDTLGTLAKSADLVMSKGALSYIAFLAHPVLSGKALTTLYNSKITELVVSDTIGSVYEKHKQYYKMIEEEALNIVNDEFSTQIYNEVNYKKRFAEIKEKIKSSRPKFTIVSCDKLLINSINRLINKQSINDLNIEWKPETV